METRRIINAAVLLGLYAAAATAGSDAAWRPEAWPSRRDLNERRALAESGRRLVLGEPATKVGTAQELAVAMGLDPARVQDPILDAPIASAAVVPNLGVIAPLEGTSMAVLSTGGALIPYAEPGFDFTPEGASGDEVILAFRVAVPPGAGTVSFSYRFLTSEYPEFIRAGFDDTFIAVIDDDTGSRVITEINVDNVSLYPANNAEADGTGYDIFTVDPEGIDDVFFATGLPDAGLTDFLRAEVQFVSLSGTIGLAFGVADRGDGLLDSAVVLDDLVVSTLDLVDVNPELLEGGNVVTDRTFLATRGKTVKGAAADGVTRLLVRFRAPGPGEVTFSVGSGGVLNEGGFEVPNEPTPVSSVNVPVGTDRYAFAVYRAPDGLERPVSDDDAERLASVFATFHPQGDGAPVEAARKLVLVRPPVVFTHGLWSSPKTWQFPLARDTRFRVRRFTNYERTNASSFSVNMPLLEEEIEDALDAYRTKRMIAVTQVDAVGHSMGGLLSRIYTNMASYRRNDNFYAGDIHRILTVDTPHTGSPLANVLLDLQNRPPPHGERARHFFAMLGYPIDRGAIEDLSKGSAALAAIEASAAPGQALVGTGGPEVLSMTPGRIGGLYGALAKYVLLLGSELFEGLQHDGVVGRRSQEGGLDPEHITAFGGFDGLHIGAPSLGVPGNTASELYSDRLLELLRVRGPTFFQPFPAPRSLPSFAELPTVAIKKVTDEPIGNGVGGVGLQITSPTPGTEVVPGTSIRVTLEPLPGTNIDRVLVGGPFTVADDEEAPFEVDLELPTELVGPVTILALGWNPDGDVFASNEPVLDAVPSAMLLSLDLRPKNPIVRAPGGIAEQLVAIGVYDDGVERDLTEVGTEFISLNEEIVSVSASGQATAGRVGVTTVLARNSELQDSVSITVLPNRHLIFTDGFETGDTTMWSPNGQ